VSDTELPLSRRRAHEQQVRHVGTGDEEYKADGPKQHEQRRADAPDELFAERKDTHGPAGIEVRVLLANLRGNRFQIGFGL
jgi:hypothetical protein